MSVVIRAVVASPWIAAMACGGSSSTSEPAVVADASAASFSADGGVGMSADEDAANGTTGGAFSLACSGSIGDFCTAGACVSTYAKASAPTSFCGTSATYVTEYPSACGSYKMVTVRSPTGDVDYYYDPSSGDLLAAVRLEQPYCVGTGSAPSGRVPLDPCTTATGATTVSIATVCGGAAATADSGV